MNGLIMIMRWSLTVMLLLITSTASSTPLPLQVLSRRKEATMGVSNGIVTGTITPQEVYDLLGVRKYNGWWDIPYICSNRHGMTNKWSRYKPVHIVDTWEVDDRNSLWYKGTDNDCGLKPVMTNSYSQLPNLYDTGAAEWSYQPPWGDRGGIAKSPYRLLDFDKYDHNAVPPIQRFSCPSKVKQNGTFTCAVMMQVVIEDENEYKNPGGLSLNEIYAGGEKLSDWYFGCLVTNTSGGMMILAAGRKQTDGTFGTGFPTFRTNSLLLNNTYYVYPFLAKNPQEQDKATVANTFLTIPNSTMVEMKVVSESELDGISIILHAKYLYLTNIDGTREKTGITGEFTVECERSGKTFTNNYVIFKHSASNYLQEGESQTKLADFTVSGNGGTYTKMFIFNIPTEYRNKNYTVTLSLQSGHYIKKIVPMEEMLPEM